MTAPAAIDLRLLPVADVGRGLCGSRASVAHGQVAWGTFSGPRSRGTVFGSQASRHQQPQFVRGSRPPRMVPAPVPRATCPDTWVACCGVARQPGCLRAVVVPPGAGTIRGCPPKVAGHGGVDAAARCRPRRSPASVGRRTGVPPPPCRHDVGMLTWRGQTTAGRLQPPILPLAARERPARVVNRSRCGVESACASHGPFEIGQLFGRSAT